MADATRLREGDKVRREVLGDEWVDPQVKRAQGDPFRQTIQDYINECCWGYAWTRPGLPRKTRSMLNLAMLTALDKQAELRGHVRGALRNGCTREEIAEVLLHATVYAGTPAGVAAFRTAAEVFDELDGKK
jgi:4-carboxymuconolactone decarboxylase